MAAPDLDRERLEHSTTMARELLGLAGVERWEAFAKVALSRRVETVPGTPPRVDRVEEMGVAVRTYRRGRSGFGAASGSHGEAARRAAEGAIAAESPTSFDPLPPARLLGASDPAPAPDLAPRGWAAHITEQLASHLGRLSSAKLALRRAVVQQGSFAWLLTTAEGFVAGHQGTSTSLLAEVQVADQGAGVWREWVHIPDAVTFEVETFARRISDRALLSCNRVATDSGLCDLILDPEVSCRLLAALSPLFVAARSGDDRLSGLLSREGLLAAPAVTVVDDRTDPTAPITGPCDGEGLPARRILLLDEGVPRHRVASYRDSVAWGETPRGGALRLSYRDYPATGLANLRLLATPGLPPAELLAATDRALYLIRPLAPTVVDPAADAYRIVASGVWIREHRIGGWHPVVELKGSLSRLLRRIEAVGTDLSWFQTEHGCVGTPSVLVRRQPVVG